MSKSRSECDSGFRAIGFSLRSIAGEFQALLRYQVSHRKMGHTSGIARITGDNGGRQPKAGMPKFSSPRAKSMVIQQKTGPAWFSSRSPLMLGPVYWLGLSVEAEASTTLRFPAE
jgi:hypothetical protein